MQFKVTFAFLRSLIKSTKGQIPAWAVQLIASQLGVEANKLQSFIDRLASLGDSVLDTVDQIINFKWQFGAEGGDHLTDGGGCDCPDCPEITGHDDVVMALKAQALSDCPEIDIPAAA